MPASSPHVLRVYYTDMAQFLIGITFEIVLLIFFVIGLLILTKVIKTSSNQSEEFADWKKRFGAWVILIIILTILMLFMSIYFKYDRFHKTVENDGKVIHPMEQSAPEEE